MNNDDEMRRRAYLQNSFNQQMESPVGSPPPHMLDSYPLNLRQNMSSPPMSNLQMFHMQNQAQSQGQSAQNLLARTQLSDNVPLNLRLSVGGNEGVEGIHRPVFLNPFQQEIMHQSMLSADARATMYSRNHDSRPFTPHTPHVTQHDRQTFSPRGNEKQAAPGNNSTLTALAAQLTSLADAQKSFMSNPSTSHGGKLDSRYAQMYGSVPNLTEHQMTSQNMQLIQSDVSGTYIPPGNTMPNGAPSPSSFNIETPRVFVEEEHRMEMTEDVTPSNEAYLLNTKATSNGSNRTTESKVSKSARATPSRSAGIQYETKDDESSCVCPVCDTSLPDVDKLKQHMLVNHNVHSVIPEQPADDVDAALNRPTEAVDPDSKALTVEAVAAAAVSKLEIFSPGLAKAYTKFACVDCGAEFKSRDKLIFHVRHHTNENTYLCTLCGKSFFKTDKLARHMLVHSGERPYVCKHCGATFTRSDKLRAHLKTRHGDDSYSCKVCRESFSDIAALKLHLSKRRCSKYKPSENEAEERRQRERDALESTFNEIAAQFGDPEIDIALMVNRDRLTASFDASIARDVELDATLLKETVLKDLNDDRMPDDRSYLDSNAEFMDETVIRPEVNLERVKAKALHAKKIDKIVKRINKYRTVACPHCDVMLPGAYTLTRHLRQAHSIVKSHEYKKKEKVPRQEGEETVPKVRVKRPALIKHCQCLVCGKNFTKLDTLKRHEVTHTGERAFQCRFCDAKYSRSDRLRKHLRSNHVSAAYPCIKCDMIFETKQELRRHITVHRVKPPKQPVEKPRMRGPYKKRKMTMAGKMIGVPNTSNFGANTGDVSQVNTSGQEQSENRYDSMNMSGMYGEGDTTAAGNNLNVTTGGDSLNGTTMSGAGGDAEPVENVFRLSSEELSNALALRNVSKSAHQAERDSLKRSHHKSIKSEGIKLESGLLDDNGEVRVKRKYIKKKDREPRDPNEPQERTHKCSHCPKMFATRRAVESHETTHTKLKLFKCKYCGDQYKHYRGLQKHMRHQHDDNLYACKRCDEIFEDADDLKEHCAESHEDYPTETIKERAKVSIKERVAERKQKVYSCRQCKKVFDIRADLERHMRVHRMKKVIKLEEESDVEESEEVVPNLTYALYEDAELSGCTNSEPSTNVLGRFPRAATQKSNGLKSEHPDDKITVKQEIDVDHINIKQEHQDFDMLEDFKFDNEDMGFDANDLPLFDSKNNLDVDYEDASDTISVDSEEYRERERKRARLLRKKKKLLTCTYCYKILPTMKRLERHMKVVHPVRMRAKNKIKSGKSRRVPHKCGKCGKTFEYIMELHRHMQKHEAAAQRYTHDCLDCGATFSSRKAFYSHANNQHGANHDLEALKEEVEDVEELVVAIDEPDESSEPVIVIRPKVEAPAGEHESAIERNARGLFQCCVCEMSFSQAAKLRRHLVTHSGEKPYRCRLCEHTFARSDKLRAHLSGIHFEPDTACLFCDQIFDSKADMRSHTLQHVEHKMIVNANKIRIQANEIEEKIRLKSLYGEPYEKPKEVKMYKKKVVKPMNSSRTNILGSLVDCKDQSGLDQTEMKYDDMNGSMMTDTDGRNSYAAVTKNAAGGLVSSMSTRSGALASDQSASDQSVELKQEAFDWTMFAPDEKKLRGPLGGNKHILCPICNKGVSSSHALKRHIVSAHTDERPYVCCDCPKSFSRMDKFRNHLRRHFGFIYPCTVCGAVFLRWYHWKKHTLVHEISCELCGYKCVNQSAMNRHIAKHTGERQFTCTFCGKQFWRNYHLQIHTRIHTGMNRSVDRSKYRPTEKQFTCTICGKQFWHNYRLQIHTRTHTGEMPYGCEICGKRFFRSDRLKRHRETHERDNGLLCSSCGKSFTSAIALKVHMHIHDIPKPQKCFHCDLSLPNSKELLKHKKTVHPTELCFTCPMCNLEFHSNDELILHVVEHTDSQGTSLDLTTLSDSKSSPTKPRSKQPYLCSMCGKTLSSRHALSRHQRVHTGEKNHKCHYCAQQFTTSYGLRRHIEKHELKGTIPAIKTEIPAEVSESANEINKELSFLNLASLNQDTLSHVNEQNAMAVNRDIALATGSVNLMQPQTLLGSLGQPLDLAAISTSVGIDTSIAFS